LLQDCAVAYALQKWRTFEAPVAHCSRVAGQTRALWRPKKHGFLWRLQTICDAAAEGVWTLRWASA